MAIISVRKELPRGTIQLRELDERECNEAGISGDTGLRHSAAASDYYDAIYVGDDLAGAWGYAAENLFSFRCRAWLLTCDPITAMPQFFMRQSVRVVRYLFERYDEIEVCVHESHGPSRKWLAWLGFQPVGRNAGFIFMIAKKEGSKWVS